MGRDLRLEDLKIKRNLISDKIISLCKELHEIENLKNLDISMNITALHNIFDNKIKLIKADIDYNLSLYNSYEEKILDIEKCVTNE